MQVRGPVLIPVPALWRCACARGEPARGRSPRQQPVLTAEAVQASDSVVTMGCGDACPVFPGRAYLDWQLDDPAGQEVDAVRPIRDEIRQRVDALLAEIASR
ncbi:hypothetical protein [Streptomyces globisporus]|uniref:hypothetical protein n=1 Tax=Streptomyces globisporus TaxID=1908 RepID=UPI0036C27878